MTLFLDRVKIHRRKLSELRDIIENVARDPGSINDTDFRRRMSEVNESVNDLLNDARGAVGKHSDLYIYTEYEKVNYSSQLP